jgi:hypothetical protein
LQSLQPPPQGAQSSQHGPQPPPRQRPQGQCNSLSMMQHPLLDANRVANSDANTKRFMVVIP